MYVSNLHSEISKAYHSQEEMEWVEVSKANPDPGDVGVMGAPRRRRRRRVVSKRTWSEAELKGRKKLQGNLSMAGSTAGLTSLGLLGASVLARKKPALVRVKPEKLKAASLNTGIVGGGIGGIGGLHFAGLQRQEVKRRELDAASTSRKINAIAGKKG